MIFAIKESSLQSGQDAESKIKQNEMESTMPVGAAVLILIFAVLILWFLYTTDLANLRKIKGQTRSGLESIDLMVKSDGLLDGARYSTDHNNQESQEPFPGETERSSDQRLRKGINQADEPGAAAKPWPARVQHPQPDEPGTPANPY